MTDKYWLLVSRNPWYLKCMWMTWSFCIYKLQIPRTFANHVPEMEISWVCIYLELMIEKRKTVCMSIHAHLELLLIVLIVVQFCVTWDVQDPFEIIHGIKICSNSIYTNIITVLSSSSMKAARALFTWKKRIVAWSWDGRGLKKWSIKTAAPTGDWNQASTRMTHDCLG